LFSRQKNKRKFVDFGWGIVDRRKRQAAIQETKEPKRQIVKRRRTIVRNEDVTAREINTGLNIGIFCLINEEIMSFSNKISENL